MANGVPQGSVLWQFCSSCIWFHLGQIVRNSNGDYHGRWYTVISSNIPKCSIKVCHCVKQMNNWRNNIPFNSTKNKTKVVVFSLKKKRIHFSEHLDSPSLKTKDLIRNLGVQETQSAMTHIYTVVWASPKPEQWWRERQIWCHLDVRIRTSMEFAKWEKQQARLSTQTLMVISNPQ